MNPEQLKSSGYHHLSGPYRMPGEEEMFCRARAHLRRGKIEYVEVSDQNGDIINLWSKPRVTPIEEDET